MSGPKAADVRLKLERAHEAVRKQMEHISNNSARIMKLGNNNLASVASSAADAFHSLSNSAPTAAMMEFSPEESRQINENIINAENLVNKGRENQRKAQALEGNAIELKRKAQDTLMEAANLVESVARSIIRKGPHYLYEEDRMADEARKKAQEALQLEKQATKKLTEALDYSKAARNDFDSAATVIGNTKKMAQRIATVAQERATAARIAEENQRNATAYASSITSLVSAIETLNHQKFAPGSYSKLKNEIAAFEKSFSSNDFAAASIAGKQLSKKLQDLEREISEVQMKFESALSSAQNNLNMARQEIETINQVELAKWSGQADDVNRAFNQLVAAEQQIIQENFSGAESGIVASLTKIRELNAVAEANRINCEQRNEIANAIMNALYEQGYDTPSYYYAKQNADGSDIELSDLTVFAKTPGTQGDMRMNINLDGKVNLEVEGIAEGEEAVCHQLIQNLQEGLAGEIDFQMTDWGRAANVNPDAKISFRQTQKVQEKNRERQNG